MMGCGLRRHPSVRGNVSDEDTAVFFSVPPSVTPPAAFKAWYAKVKALNLEGDVLSELGRDMHSKGSLP